MKSKKKPNSTGSSPAPDSACDWDPLSEEVLRDQLLAHDQMRERCPVAYSDKMGWSVFRHDDVLQVLQDPSTFSSVVSDHPSVPNGFDPPRHTEYRRIIEPLFTAQKVHEFEPTCRRIAESVLKDIAGRQEIEFVCEFAERFAVRAQCAFLGWPEGLEAPLLQWLSRSQRATLSGDRAVLSDVADEFSKLVAERIVASQSPDNQGDGLTVLKLQTVTGSPLSQEEIVSLVRNLTVGEVATLSASLAIVVYELATSPEVQKRVRSQMDDLPYAIEETLRKHGPLLTNRRRTTCPVKLGDRHIDAGERITVMWPAANRDARIFDNPNDFQWDRPQDDNLLYGKGLHICPGAGLARLELLVALKALLNGTQWLKLNRDKAPRLASYPASGFATMPIVMER
jgi:cytochrome P450